MSEKKPSPVLGLAGLITVGVVIWIIYSNSTKPPPTQAELEDRAQRQATIDRARDADRADVELVAAGLMTQDQADARKRIRWGGNR